MELLSEQFSSKEPAHQQVYQQIREMILFGVLAPGEPITILGLIDRIGAGMTPVREALRRLTAEGALHLLGNRRVVVPVLDRATLDQLAFARLALEPHLASLACVQLENKHIAEMSELDVALNEAISHGDITGYLRLNHAFHMALYGHAQAPLLVSVVSSLWLRVGPSLRVVCGRWGTMQLTDCHANALAAMRAHDPDRLASAIRDDITQGIDMVAQSLTI
jgi:DNA-binding GntR family transcriptional regulator